MVRHRPAPVILKDKVNLTKSILFSDYKRRNQTQRWLEQSDELMQAGPEGLVIKILPISAIEMH